MIDTLSQELTALLRQASQEKDGEKLRQLTDRIVELIDKREHAVKAKKGSSSDIH